MKIEIKDASGKVLFTESLDPRTFSTGKVGFGAYGKVSSGADRYQMSFNLVKIVPKS